MGQQCRLGLGSRSKAFAVVAGLCCALLAIAVGEVAEASYPGSNGRIAFTLEAGGAQAIGSANADGSAPLALTQGKEDSEASYSADGTRIALEREDGIAVMNADGSGLVKIAGGSTSGGNIETTWQANYEVPESAKTIPWVMIRTFAKKTHRFRSPAFTPDGTQIAVAEEFSDEHEEEICAVANDKDENCLPESNPGSYYGFVYVCTGCLAHLVTISAATGAITGQVTPGVDRVYDADPVFSAAGKLAFVRYVSGPGAGLYVIGAPGAPPVQLVGDESYAPDFSPDGSRLVFIHNEVELLTIPTTGGLPGVVPVPPPPPGLGGGFLDAPVFSPDGTQLAFQVYRSEVPAESGTWVSNVDGSGPHRITTGGDPSWQPIPIPPPPATKSKARSKKGRIKLDKQGRAVVGSITCGSSPCTVKLLKAQLKAGKSRCGATAKFAKKLAALTATKVQATVKGKCLAKLVKAGKGRLTLKFSVTSAAGTEALTIKATLVPHSVKKAKGKGK